MKAPDERQMKRSIKIGISRGNVPDINSFSLIFHRFSTAIHP